MASQQWQGRRDVLELAADFVLVAAFGELWAPPGRELSRAPEQQTTSQLTPPAGEAGQQTRQKTSNVPFMGLEKPPGSVYRSASGRPLSALGPIRPGNKRKAGERGEGQQRHKQTESCLRWKQRCGGRGPFISPLVALVASRNKWKMCVGVLPFSGCGSVVSGWCCDWSWIDSCRRPGKAGPPEKGQVDAPHTCSRMERRQPGYTLMGSICSLVSV